MIMSRYRWRKIACILAFISCLSSTLACPAICSCKWKGGKQTVECTDKDLATIPAGIETGTQVLNFEGNNLQTLRKHAFLSRKLINLQKINLGSCNLGVIDEDAFVQLSNLVELNLSHNLLTQIPGAAFKHTPALRDLNLAGNPISSVSAGSFTFTSSLVHLDISSGKIKNINPSAFLPLSLLEKLDIHNNRLREIPKNVVNSLRNSHGLKLHGNPFYCDCRALPLWRLLQQKRIPHPESPICSSPRRVANARFDTLEEDDFACPPEIKHAVKIIKGFAGENATLTCPVGGQPSPNIIWYIADQPVINGSILGMGPQRVYIVNGEGRNKVSRLIITGAQEADSGSIRCIAVNPAGRATVNFTLAVTMKAITKETYNSGHIAGIAVGLVVLALVIFIIAFMLFAKSRSTSSPSPIKDRSPVCSLPCSPSEPNPIQKPPRLTDLSSSNSADPDLISEAERSVKGNNSNGFIPNGHSFGPAVSDVGDYTRMEGDSLYPSSLWDSQGLHEHYNPGFVPQDSPYRQAPQAHSTPSKTSLFDPQIYGYPQDYGLPIPEVEENPMYVSRQEISPSSTLVKLNNEGSTETTYASRKEIGLQDNSAVSGYGSSPLNQSGGSSIFELVNMDRVKNHQIKPILENDPANPGSRLNIVDGDESPKVNNSLGERPWVPGSQNNVQSGVPMGIQVLPPLPNNLVHRLKSRDSPDEGYQEGTEV